MSRDVDLLILVQFKPVFPQIEFAWISERPIWFCQVQIKVVHKWEGEHMVQMAYALLYFFMVAKTEFVKQVIRKQL